MTYKDKEQQRLANKEAQRRCREGMTGNGKGMTGFNEELVLRLADKTSEARLRTICMSLNKQVTGVSLDGKPVTVNLLDQISIGCFHPVSLRSIYGLLRDTPVR